MLLFCMELFLLYFIFMAVKGKLGNKWALLVAILVSVSYLMVYKTGLFCTILNRGNIVGTVALGICIFCSVVVELLFYFTRYHVPYVRREEVFAGKKVLAFVPHGDDEVNLLGSLPMEYAENGSEFYLAYLTNSDSESYEWGQLRLKEAILAAHNMRIRKDHVFFLGYGCRYVDNVLCADDNAVLISSIGRYQTYALQRKQPFLRHEYTKSNMMNDIEKLIYTLKPDVIFCVDKDSHVEHQLLSELFDRVVVRMKTGDYNPTIYKGFAYSTAWMAEDDFYAEINILSSKRPNESLLQSYKWEKRIRFPVADCDLSRVMSGCRSYWTLRQHKSQNAVSRCGRIINGDKVFWRVDDFGKSAAWVKFTDKNGNFLYDCVTTDESLELYLYDSREGEMIDIEPFEVALKNDFGCKYIKCQNKIIVEFSEKANGIMEVRDMRNSYIYDVIRIGRVSHAYRNWIGFLSNIEKFNEYRLLTQWHDFKYLITTLILK